MDTDTAMTIVEAIAELNRRAERIRELEAEREGAHSCHDKCPRPLCVANRRIRELEELVLRHGRLWAKLDLALGDKRMAGDLTCADAAIKRIRELEEERAEAFQFILRNVDPFQLAPLDGDYYDKLRNRAIECE